MDDELLTVNQIEEKKTPEDKKKEKRPLKTFIKLTGILGIIGSTLTMMYYLLPIFSTFLGAIIALFIVLFIFLAVVFTLGISLTFDGFRNWIGNHAFDVPNFFFDVGKHINELSPFFPAVAFPSLSLMCICFILAIIAKSLHVKRTLPFIILGAIFVTLDIMFIFFYYANGGKTFS